MESREFVRLQRSVSVVGLGTWQLGADWGSVSEDDALAVLAAAAEAGVSIFDTADVYGDGRSEQLIGRFLRDNPGLDCLVATKMGRRVEQLAGNYTAEAFQDWTQRSRDNLGTDRLDLVQLHCPPDEVFADDRIFDALDGLVADGAIAGYGVSVETCAQALAAIARPNVASVQIILNAFRQKPLDEVLPAAAAAGVAIIARVPLASGLLSGKYTRDTVFAADDHRNYNRDGAAFDVGETFSGVDFETGVQAASEFSTLVAEHLDGAVSPAAAALRWVIDQPGVTTVIPGARNVGQARANADAAAVGPLPASLLSAVGDLYDRRIRPDVHQRW